MEHRKLAEAQQGAPDSRMGESPEGCVPSTGMPEPGSHSGRRRRIAWFEACEAFFLFIRSLFINEASEDPD